MAGARLEIDTTRVGEATAAFEALEAAAVRAYEAVERLKAQPIGVSLEPVLEEGVRD